VGTASVDDQAVSASSHPLRILMVTPDIPFPPTGGAPMRNYQLLRHLAQRHAVSLLTYQRRPSPEGQAALAEFCESVWTVNRAFPGPARKRWLQLRSLVSPSSYLRWLFFSRPMQDAIDKALERHSFDIVQVESSLMACFRFDTDARLVLDEHNVEYEVLDRIYRAERSPIRKAYNWGEYHKLRREELDAWKRFDACVITSEREAASFRRLVPGTPCAVVENGVDPEYFIPDSRAPDPNSIVFTGRLDYRPNADAVGYFVRDILPSVVARRPAATLTIVGADVPPEVKRLEGPNVRVTGWVADVRPYLATAAAVIAPLRMGGGTRIKILEALAMGKAVISTSVGSEGLGVLAGEHLLVADAPQAFAAEVARVLDDSSLAGRLGTAGRRLVEQRYRWATVARSLEDFHVNVANRPSRHTLHFGVVSRAGT
jgi:sugar transferase (PEP-CTERM/EpsH1 system associated)